MEPEDELKPETFAVLKAVAEEDQDEDGADDADVDETEEVEDDESEADESSLKDLTVEELQTRCKAAGIQFKAKKTTKAQLIAALEAYEAEQDENASEEDDEPEPEVKPEKKATPSKPAAPVKAEKTEKKEKKDFSISNKAIVWKAWNNGKGETSPSALNKIAPDVQEKTIKAWIQAWTKGKNLPAVAK